MPATIHSSKPAVSDRAEGKDLDLKAKAQAIIAKRKTLLDRLAKQ